ncbi:hypothetical protein EFK50_00635 [Nocardioides marmoriginsengisoli]|uniref:Antibiotic acetyltransferase n=2 Tax=Nocardioides marmoriginsengisoli TaxID=661483 RepID=A0A3N0CS30_9ACTN|nr:hypothetical protein EFK50_00635 [Nocardioides marmoriginsengisoli]
MQPKPPKGLRARLNAKLKARVRYWVDGAEIVHWDDPRQRITWDAPSYPTVKLLESFRGKGSAVHLGAYSGMHYTAVVITGGQHHLDWVSIMHAHEEDGQWSVQEENLIERGPVQVGSDVWVGFEALIMSGVTIGHGAVVGARAVVASDVEPYSVVVGNPARHVKYRFDEPTREALLRICWWDWDKRKVAAHKDQIHGPEVAAFVAAHDPALGTPSCPVCAAGW